MTSRHNTTEKTRDPTVIAMYDQIIEEVKEPVFSFILSLYGKCRPGTPRDLDFCCDVFEKTCDAARETIDRKLADGTFYRGRPEALFLTIARRTFFRDLKRRARQVDLPKDCAAPGATHLSRMLTDTEFGELLEHITQLLPDRERIVFNLYVEHYDEFGKRDIYVKLTDLVNQELSRPLTSEAVRLILRRARKLACGYLNSIDESPESDRRTDR